MLKELSGDIWKVYKKKNKLTDTNYIVWNWINAKLYIVEKMIDDLTIRRSNRIYPKWNTEEEMKFLKNEIATVSWETASKCSKYMCNEVLTEVSVN